MCQYASVEYLINWFVDWQKSFKSFSRYKYFNGIDYEDILSFFVL